LLEGEQNQQHIQYMDCNPAWSLIQNQGWMDSLMMKIRHKEASAILQLQDSVQFYIRHIPFHK
jgi:hypothetical protein